jgi:ATP-dependent RNA helicase DHX29
MAKKKKTQLKPVARGFATTSVPKKVVQPEDQPDSPEDAGTVDGETHNIEDARWTGDGTGVQPHAVEFDPDKVEEHSLQNLVDKLQEKTEKEIVRTIKVCRLAIE